MKKWIVPATIVLAVLIVYGNALFNGFVYDDGYLIQKNDFIKDWKHAGEIFLSDVTVASPLGKASGYYRPVSMLFLMLSYHVWGLNSFGLHFNSILLHVLNCLLVFWIIKRISAKETLAWVCAIVFAVHPVHVEAVTPIYNFMGILATFFSLASFWAFLKSDGLKNIRFAVFSAIFFALGVLSKEEVFVLPAIFVLYDYYFSASFQIGQVLKNERYRFFVGVAIFYLAMRLWIIEQPAALGFWDLNLTFNVASSQNIFLHLGTVLKIFSLYAGLLIFPVYLSAFHMVSAIRTIFSWEAFGALVVVASLIFTAISTRKKAPLVSFFIWFFFLSSLMVANFIPIGGLFAERFMYLPSLSFCFIFGYIFDAMINKQGKDSNLRKITILICFICIFLLGLQTAVRNYVWRSNISLWQDTVVKSPKSFIAHLNLADSYFEAGKLPEALGEYQKSLELGAFKQFYIHNAIGKIYGMQKEYQLALQEFEEALKANPNFVETHYNLGITHYNQGEFDLALSYFNAAQKLQPNYPWAYYGIGLVLAKEERLAEARAMLAEVLKLDPNFQLAQKALKELEK